MCKLIIPLNGWAAGERRFAFAAGTEFFQMFDNQDILDADVNVDVRVVKEGMHRVKADLHLCGTVTVACDRCLEPLGIPVDASAALDYRADLPDGEEYSEDGAELLPLPQVGEDLDLSQCVYDYVCLSLPLQRVHPEGECNPDTVQYLGHVERKNEEADNNSPFAALKGLFDEK